MSVGQHFRPVESATTVEVAFLNRPNSLSFFIEKEHPFFSKQKTVQVYDVFSLGEISMPVSLTGTHSTFIKSAIGQLAASRGVKSGGKYR